jgi:dolichol-phosphate mannosyltransferase
MAKVGTNLRKSLTLFVPVYNEEESIPDLLRDFKYFTSECLAMNVHVEILIHDNFSSDRSVELFREGLGGNSNTKVLCLPRNIGYQSSLALSFSNASGDAYLIYQSDRQDPIEIAIKMVSSWVDGNKFIVGVARSRADGLLEKIGRRIFVWILRHATDLPLNEWFTDFYLIDKSIYKQFSGLETQNQFIRGRLIESFEVDELIYYDRSPRLKGKSKFTFASKYSLALDALLLHSTKIIRKITSLGLFFSLFSIIGGGALTMKYTLEDNNRLVFLSLTLTVLLVLCFIIILLIGFLLEYLSRIHKTLQSGRESAVRLAELTVERGVFRS